MLHGLCELHIHKDVGNKNEAHNFSATMYHMVLVNANIWINLKCYTRNKTSIHILHVFVNILNI